MKAQLIALLLLFFTTEAHAAINPDYANAMERGYSISGDSVVFPNGSKCLLSEFNNGTCGQKWMTEDYCVPEGAYVWNNDRCCEGLEPYLKKGYDGQKRCVKKQKDDEEKKEESSWWNDLMSNSMFWIGLLIPFILLIYIAISVKKRIKNQNE